MMAETAENGRQQRLTVPEYVKLCMSHLRANWYYYGLPVLVIGIFQIFFRLDFNYTSSLPDHVFVTVKHMKSGFKRGDYIAYHFPTEHRYSPFRKGDHMMKIVLGVPGDEIFMDADRNFYLRSKSGNGIDHQFLGQAKKFSLAGKPLEPGPVGVIPEGRYFASAPHKDSLDSRYAMVGWIGGDDIMGRAFSLF